MDAECSFSDYCFINFANTESLLTTSQYAKVIFHNIEEKYSIHEDLTCLYSLTEQFNAQTGDRVILFKLGWQQITDYVLFEWVFVPENNSPLKVQFKAETLPRDENEFYQFCYISGENTVCGASIPFQFRNLKDNLVTTSTDSECFVSLQMESSKSLLCLSNEVSGSLTESKLIEANTTITTDSTSKSEVKTAVFSVNVSQLIEGNKHLQSELHETNASLQNCDSQISELKVEIESLKSLLRITQNDVSDLKARMDIANEEYKKLYAEKARTEKKYEKLVKKCQGKSKKNSDSNTDFLGELEPLPPFPLLM